MTIVQTMRDQAEAMSVSFSPGQKREVSDAHMEALGYARGRMDATQDHGLPWSCGVDPLAFAASFELHVAEYIARTRDGMSASRSAIRDHWEWYLD